VEELIARHGLGNRVSLTGPLPDEDVDALFGRTDLFVLPSLGETFGMVVTEALARGIPVLTSDIDALPDTLGQAPDGSVPGMLVPPGDPAALSAALRRYLIDATLRGRLRESARERRRYLEDWQVAGARLAAVLDGLRGGEPSCAA
jgi:glycosyltransferase involved in cell wall biosynthesis